MHVAALIVAVLWFTGNVWLWSLKQSDTVLFWQTLAAGGIAFPLLYWYLGRSS